MKCLLAVVLVLAAATIGECIFAETVRLGAISEGDVLLHRSIVFAPAIDSAFQTTDLKYQGTTNVTVTALIATPVGPVERPLIATVINGGVGLPAVQFRFLSNRGSGLNYILDIWGRQ